MTTSTRVHSATRLYTWPPLRFYNAVADRIAPGSGRLGRPDELRAAAVQSTGLSDFGDPAYEAGLTAFSRALVTEADLTPAGRRFAGGAIEAALTNRLWIQREFTAEPRMPTRPVGPALVVLGLPRSGTTLLQNLLALDPANRSLRQWEASRPAPAPTVGAEEHDPRVRSAERATWLLDRIAPSARALHPTGPRMPTECVTLFANSFASLEVTAIYQVPSYARWLLATDMRPHYSYYAQQLSLLSWHDHRERWSLKSPAHLFWVDELVEALPEARLVMLHRDPAEVIASFCSLAATLTGTSARTVDRAALGAFWVDTWAEGLARAERARDRVQPNRWHDLRYADLVADPTAAVRRIYAAFDLPFPDEFAAAIGQHVLLSPQHGRGVHRYALDDFGLAAEPVRETFAPDGVERWR